MLLPLYFLEKIAARKKSDIDSTKKAMQDEEIQLAIRAQQGDSFAMKELVRRLEGSIQIVQRSQFAGSNQPTDVTHQHLVRLVKEAIMSYDPNRVGTNGRKANLNTHVRNYISQKGKRFANKYNNIAKMDEKESSLVGPINNAMSELGRDGYTPSDEEVTRWIKSNYPDKKNVTIDLVESTRRKNVKEIMGSTAIKSGEGGMTMGDIANTSHLDPREEMARRMREEAVLSAVNKLPFIHQKVLLHKTGSFDHEKLKNVEIAMKYNLPSAYQVGKIHEEAQGMLRNHLRGIFGEDDD